MAKEVEMDQRQAYGMAAEAFRFMHNDATLPATPHNLSWSQEGSDRYVLEADGSKLTGSGPVPARWVVHLRHSNDTWTVVKADWK
jgi:hypothetical protein